MKTYKERLTEELVKVTVEYLGKSYWDSDTLIGVITKVSGKQAHVTSIPSISRSYRNIYLTPEESDIKKIKDLFDGIVSEYGFTGYGISIHIGEGEDYYNPRFSGFKKNSGISCVENLMIRDDAVFAVTQCNGYPEIQFIVYTEDTIEIAMEILKKYSEACFEVVKDHEEEISKSYEIITVISENGNYSPVTTNIFPSVTLEAPDFMDNYNKDFPGDRISQFINMDKGGIMIFNGHPGCGKSTYLKSLIFKNPEVKFVILPQYLLVGQEAFRNFLFKMCSGPQELIFIVEDCEQLLIQREDNSIQFSSIISDILNYTDGIYGDLTRTKFIFTFNTNLKNIDKAILRPGRLFLKYEFSPLIGENLEKLAKKLEYPLTQEEKKTGLSLAELYSKSKAQDLIISERPKRRIGFPTTDGCCCEAELGF